MPTLEKGGSKFTGFRQWGHHLLATSGVGLLTFETLVNDRTDQLSTRQDPRLLAKVKMYPIYRSVMMVEMNFHHQRTGEIMIFGQNNRVFSVVRKMRFNDSAVNSHETFVI